MPFVNSFSPSWIPRDSWDGSPVMQFCENRWNHWMAAGFWTWEDFLWWYIYIHIFLYTTGTVCICLYATKMRAPFKESVVQKFPFFWGEWLYITQIKVDIYQAKGSFLVKIGEEKTTQMVGMEREIIFLPWQWRAEWLDSKLNDWMIVILLTSQYSILFASFTFSFIIFYH